MTKRLLYHINNLGVGGYKNSQTNISELTKQKKKQSKGGHKLSQTSRNILDIGCGTGFSLEILDNAIGIDISEPMLKIAKKKGFQKLIRADFKHLPFKSNSFDIAVSISTIQWITGKTPEEVISQYRQFCKELKRILKKKGKAGLQFYPATKREMEVLTDELKKFFRGHIVEEGKGKKQKKYIILESK